MSVWNDKKEKRASCQAWMASPSFKHVNIPDTDQRRVLAQEAGTLLWMNLTA